MAGNNGVPSPYWAALIGFAQQVGVEDPVNQTPSQIGQLSEADHNWLTQAMVDLVEQTDDPVVKMKEAVKVLMETDCQSAVGSDVDRALHAIYSLARLISHRKMATSFYQIGGFRLLFPLLASSNAKLRSATVYLIGELVEYCQEKLTEAHMIRVLEEMLATDSDSRCRANAVCVISYLVFHGPKITEELVRQDAGVAHLLGALHVCPHGRAAGANSDLKEAAVRMGMVGHLATVLQLCLPVRRCAIRQFVTSALLNLVNGCPKAQEECRRPEFGLKTTLEDRLRAMQCSEKERKCIRQILSVCWPPNSVPMQSIPAAADVGEDDDCVEWSSCRKKVPIYQWPKNRSCDDSGDGEDESASESEGEKTISPKRVRLSTETVDGEAISNDGPLMLDVAQTCAFANGFGVESAAVAAADEATSAEGNGQTS